MRKPQYEQFKVIQPGLFTTIQDSGRHGYQQYGVPINGALDSFAAEMANYLVGNGPEAAILECTLAGPKLLVLEEALIALTGAAMEVKLNSKPVARWAAVRVRRGDTLELGQAESGCRSYLAVTGGLAVPEVMGSRSCYVGGRIGGLHGRPLQPEDRLPRGIGLISDHGRKIPERLIPEYPNEIVLRVIPGPQDDYFDEGLATFFNSTYRVSADANRMGYRLEGPEVVQKIGLPQSIISESSLPGGIQIPPNGQPIILLVEQTVGGYTKIATVISSDIHLIAQARPGDHIRFQEVDLQAAYGIARAKKKLTENLQQALTLLDSAGETYKQTYATPVDPALQSYQELYPGC